MKFRKRFLRAQWQRANQKQKKRNGRLPAPHCESLEDRRLLSVTVLPAQTPIPFTKVVVDPNPGRVPLEKTLADLEGTGQLDIVVGHDTGSGGPGGIEWYQFPKSGKVTDHWNEYTIAVPGGEAYEDMVPCDLEGNGVVDIIASYNNQVVWFENPRNTGGDPTKGPWTMHVIGPDPAHELALADLDGDGKVDVATRTHIYFQNSTTSWTTIPTADYGNHNEVGVTNFDSGSGLGEVDLAGASANGLQLGWYENPRDHGGDARTSVWTFHAIGNSYSTNTSIGVSFASLDVNGDGRQDIITAQGESGTLPGPPPGGMIWWEAPTNRATGTWVAHTIDGTLQDVHKITLGDMNHDGRTDIVFSEQEQSAQDRVGILYNTDGTGINWNEEVISNDSGHNQYVGDVDGDGNLDILNVPHGVYTGVNPVELFMSDLPAAPSKPVISKQPSDQSVLAGGTVTFSVAASGAGSGLTYQWQRNGHDIDNADESTYIVTDAGLEDSGETFDCIVGNSDGTVTSNTATLTVIPPPPPGSLFIDSGGSATGSYVADTDFSGGKTYGVANTIDTSAIPLPAPQQVYQTERYGNFTYTIPNLNPSASYNVELDFSENYWSAAGQRIFNVAINGTPFLTNFDIYATAGAQYKAVAKSFTAIADGSGKIVVSFTGVKDSAKVDAIDITPAAPPIPTPTITGLSNVILTQPQGQYNATGSFTDAGPGPWAATVDYGDGSGAQPLTLNGDNSFSLSHGYDANHTKKYIVTVAITDTTNNTNGTASPSVSVVDVAPSNVNFTGGPASFAIPVGGTLSLTGSFMDPGAGNGDTFTQTNDYGDGSTVETLNPTTTAIAAQHTYATQGVYTLHTTITDADGASSDVKYTITVGHPPIVQSPVLQIDSGGPAAGAYVADTDYSGGTAYSVSNAIDTSAVTNPPPQSAYQTERYGNFTYTLPGLSAGASYTVRLQFSENYWSAAGKRVFNVAINGTSVLTNFDIYATAGGKFKAIAQSFTAIANSSGKILIAFTSVKDSAKISAIDVTPATPATPAPVVTGLGSVTLAPAQGQYTATGSFTDAGPGPWTATVDYGDGTGAQPLTLNNDNTFSLSHSYDSTQSKKYAISVVVTDIANNTSGSAIVSVTVGNPPVVQAPVLQIDTGGPAVGSYLADTDFSGGHTYSVGNTIDTSAITNPAPQQVYQTERYGNSTYTLPGLSPGASYTVELDFSENYWSAAGQRLFNVAINGTQVLNNFDIFATAGGKYTAIAQTFTAIADSSGQITIVFTGVKDNAKADAIDVTPD